MIIIDFYLIVAVVMFIAGIEVTFFGMASDKKRVIRFGVALHMISLATTCLLFFRNILW